MKQMRMARRSVGDIVAVCRCARPASAARWLLSFAAHLPECQSTRSIVPADHIWAWTGARFRPPGGVVITLPAAYTAGAREMYCRNVYLRTGFSLPHTGWVLDLGANRGLFSVQVVIEVLGNFGDAAALVGRLRQHGFAADLRENAGTRVCATSSRLDYAYFQCS